jgi:anti-anti-sigma factor
MSNVNRFVSQREEQGVTILKLELARISDYEVAEAIGKALVEAALQAPSPKVVVDMEKIQYMSSVGYGPLITLRSRVLEAGGQLVLCRLSKVVQEMFEATRLLINPRSPSSLFEVRSTVEEAVQTLRS